MRRYITCLFAFFPGILLAQFHWQTAGLVLTVDTAGHIQRLYDRAGEVDYLSGDTTAALLTICIADQTEQPAGARWDPASRLLQLAYPQSGARIELLVTEKKTHLVLEVVSAEPAEAIDAIIWGPYPTTIGQVIGEIVGVVRNERYALGIQALNPETTGGLLENSEGMVPGRGSAARKTAWGSTLQAFALNRAKERKADVWWGTYKDKPVTPLAGMTVVGSKIALFGCLAEDALGTIGAIEVAEGLPHPTIRGVWVKQSPLAGHSYLISSFSEQEVDEMIAATRRAGLISLYHEGPFKTWGHYDINTDQFPDGKASLKRCVEKAHAAGLFFGVHTLTNFINTNDPYVSPVPDPRLVLTGSSTLTTSLDPNTTEIPVADPVYFRQDKGNNLRTVRIGDELIRYWAVSPEEPWVLLDCRRGAFGTKATSHAAGAPVGKLLDHPYKVFFPELELQNEIARNLADLFNETGIDHLDFDGHEGGLACGQGDYGIDMFAQVFHETIDHEYLNGTSLSKHYYWHINTYCNWGEPWYGGFRESMQEYRIRNQELFDRNFMPHMLGWYLMTATTSLPEMEWMLARAAGYNAGFAMVLRPAALRANPIAGTLLDAIREWEAARNADAFSPEQQQALRDPSREFHLEKTGDNTWMLYPMHNAAPFRHGPKELQPGEPTGSDFQFRNPDDRQVLQFRLEVAGDSGTVQQIRLTLDQYYTVDIPVKLSFGEALVCDGSPVLRIYDQKGRQRDTQTLADTLPDLKPGLNTLSLDAEFKGGPAHELVLTVKTRGAGMQVRASK